MYPKSKLVNVGRFSFFNLNLFSWRENLGKAVYEPLDGLAYLGRYGLAQLCLCGLDPNKVYINLNILAYHINK